MKVRVTFDVDEATRLAIAYRYGRDIPASRQDIESNILGIVEETWTDYRHERETGEARPDDEDES